MRVLGIDPGSRYCGFGVVEDAGGTRVRHLAHGVFILGADRPIEDRLRSLHEGLAAALAQHRPEVVAVEDVFHARNARSALVLGQARGVAFLLGLHSGSVSGAVGNGEHARLVVVHPCHGAATPAGKHASDLRRSEQPVAAEGAVAGDLALVRPGPDGPRTHAQGPGNFRSPQ